MHLLSATIQIAVAPKSARSLTRSMPELLSPREHDRAGSEVVRATMLETLPCPALHQLIVRWFDHHVNEIRGAAVTSNDASAPPRS